MPKVKRTKRIKTMNTWKEFEGKLRKYLGKENDADFMAALRSLIVNPNISHADLKQKIAKDRHIDVNSANFERLEEMRQRWNSIHDTMQDMNKYWNDEFEKLSKKDDALSSKDSDRVAKIERFKGEFEKMQNLVTSAKSDYPDTFRLKARNLHLLSKIDANDKQLANNKNRLDSALEASKKKNEALDVFEKNNPKLTEFVKICRNNPKLNADEAVNVATEFNKVVKTPKSSRSKTRKAFFSKLGRRYGMTDEQFNRAFDGATTLKAAAAASPTAAAAAPDPAKVATPPSSAAVQANAKLVQLEAEGKRLYNLLQNKKSALTTYGDWRVEDEAKLERVLVRSTRMIKNEGNYSALFDVIKKVDAEFTARIEKAEKKHAAAVTAAPAPKVAVVPPAPAKAAIPTPPPPPPSSAAIKKAEKVKAQVEAIYAPTLSEAVQAKARQRASSAPSLHLPSTKAAVVQAKGPEYESFEKKVADCYAKINVLLDKVQDTNFFKKMSEEMTELYNKHDKPNDVNEIKKLHDGFQAILKKVESVVEQECQKQIEKIKDINKEIKNEVVSLARQSGDDSDADRRKKVQQFMQNFGDDFNKLDKQASANTGSPQVLAKVAQGLSAKLSEIQEFKEELKTASRPGLGRSHS